MRLGHRLTCLLSATLCLGGAAVAEEDAPGRFSVDAILENLGEGGSRVRLEGQAPHLPNGTSLHVTVSINRGPMAPLQTTFFRIPVREKRIEGSQGWEEHRLAPGTYGVKVELFVDEQAPHIKRWLGRELGHGPNDRVELSFQQVSVGSAADRNEARLKHLRQARAFAVRAEGVRHAVAEAMNATSGKDPAWPDTKTDLSERMRKLQEDIRSYRRPWVALEQDWLFTAVEDVIFQLSRNMLLHERLPSGAADRVVRLQSAVQKVITDIDSLLPAEEREAVEDEDEDEDERPEEEGE